MSHHPWGLYYSFENRTISLPLLHVKAAASLKELAAQVKLTQTYLNDSDVVLDAAYSFPIPARAAVCSFVMIKQDETRVVGHVQEKGEAREIYESAVAQGKQAALMEQQTPDVFQLAVGNIQPKEKVQIELIYATELAEDEENDSVRFHLPVDVAHRYGRAPDATQIEATGSQPSFLEIFVNVEAVAPIAKIGSPSHNVSTELGPDPELPNAKELPFANYARISLSSEAALDKDFVLTVKSTGLDTPRCVAELHPIHPTTALTFTLVPRFKLPDLSRQEFVFLVDRSGSMKGPRIAAAKRALVVMLRSLPAKDSLFQIASFGNACTMLWGDGSLPYNQTTLDEATQHVDSVEANYGGTKIREALAHCFAARKTDRPTSVFVLTDGAAWDVDGVLAEVKTAVARCTAQAYLRVSVLGIGNSASTAMCEGIARVGSGTCMMVGEQETTFTGKIARMLKAARTPLITNIAVDWGVPVIEASEAVDEQDEFVMVSNEEENENTAGKEKGKEKEKAALNIFDDTVDPLQADNDPVPPPPAVVLAPPSQVQQSPFKIRTLSPGNRLNVYAILQGKTVPQNVTLTGLAEDGSAIRLSVPVTLSNLPNTPDSPLAIHALAARKIIQDHEDGQHAITTSIPDDALLLARTVKASIVRLAKTYSISSSQTSFVAVDESGTQHWQYDSPPTASPQVVRKRRNFKSLESSSGSGPGRAPRRMARMVTASPEYPSPWQTTDRAQLRVPDLAAITLRLQKSQAVQDTDQTWTPPESSLQALSFDSLDKLASPRGSSLARLMAPFGPSEGGEASAPARPAPPEHVQVAEAGFKRFRRGVANVSRSQEAEPSIDPLETLARLQSFDGCFGQAVLSTVRLNIAADEARAALGVSGEVFATVIAMAFLCTKLGPDVERESWEAIYDKARAFVEDALQNVVGAITVDELQAQAVGFLV